MGAATATFIASLIGALGSGVSAGIGAGTRGAALIKKEATDSINRQLIRVKNRIEEQNRQGSIDRQFRQGERAEAQQVGATQETAKWRVSQEALSRVNRGLQLLNQSGDLRERFANRTLNKRNTESRIQ